jgi:hypothetical protein
MLPAALTARKMRRDCTSKIVRTCTLGWPGPRLAVCVLTDSLSDSLSDYRACPGATTAATGPSGDILAALMIAVKPPYAPPVGGKAAVDTGADKLV